MNLIRTSTFPKTHGTSTLKSIIVHSFVAAYRSTERPTMGYHSEEVTTAYDGAATSSKSVSGTKYSTKKMEKSGIHSTEHPVKKPSRKPTPIPDTYLPPFANTGAAPGSGPAPGYGKPKMCYLDKMLRQILPSRKETRRGKCDERLLCKKITFIADLCSEEYD